MVPPTGESRAQDKGQRKKAMNPMLLGETLARSPPPDTGASPVPHSSRTLATQKASCKSLPQEYPGPSSPSVLSQNHLPPEVPTAPAHLHSAKHLPLL